MVVWNWSIIITLGCPSASWARVAAAAGTSVKMNSHCNAMGNSTGTVRSLGTRRCRLGFPAGIRFSRVRLQLHRRRRRCRCRPHPLHARTGAVAVVVFPWRGATTLSAQVPSRTSTRRLTGRAAAAAVEVTNFSVPIRVYA